MKRVSSGTRINLPYDRVYIYELVGVLKEEPELGEHFIGNWVEDDTSFLFFSKPVDPSFLSKLINIEVKNFYEVNYGEWEAGGAISSFTVGDIVIKPVWEGGTPSDKEIIIDPSVVFGSGFHPTTRGCLEALWGIKDERVKKILDLGTGTGILSLYALRLFPESFALAIDKNPLCVKCALKNAELNELTDRMKVLLGDARDFLDSGFDLLLANMPYEVILSLMEEKSFYKGRIYILSGFMGGGGKRIVEKAEERGLRVLSSMPSGDWLVLTLISLA